MHKLGTQTCRIIGGSLRGRKIRFPALTDIRPTPDRVRETLFNWLQMKIQDALCLDLFAGSGALGFEALSRGARHVVMVDESPIVIEHLRETAQLFSCTSITLYKGRVPDKIMLPPEPFDIVFLDPPFHKGLIKKTCDWLVQQKLINSNSYIYIEIENITDLLLPESWEILKQGKTRHVAYYLVTYSCNN